MPANDGSSEKMRGQKNKGEEDLPALWLLFAKPPPFAAVPAEYEAVSGLARASFAQRAALYKNSRFNTLNQ